MAPRAQRCTVIFAALAMLPAAAALSAETRTHYAIADRARTPHYSVTAIAEVSEERGDETYLIAAADGARLVIRVRRDYPHHRLSAEYVYDSRKPARVIVDLPLRATTRSESLEEMRRGGADADVPVLVEGRGSIRTSERALQADRDGKLRARVRAAAGEDVAAAFTAIRSILAFPPLGGACSTLPILTGGKRCAGDPALMIAAALPDCSFDASFGMPCSEEQKARAKSRRDGLNNGAY